MSGTIYLIIEAEKDFEIVKAILRLKGIDVELDYRFIPETKSSSPSYVLSELDKQIRSLLVQFQAHDCIMVLHDANEHTDLHTPSLKAQIKQLCDHHRVKQIIARNEIESWILSDSGITNWLQIPVERNWDQQKKSKQALQYTLRRKGLFWRGRDREKVFAQMVGDGDQRSASMREAVRELLEAPCVKS